MEELIFWVSVVSIYTTTCIYPSLLCWCHLHSPRKLSRFHISSQSLSLHPSLIPYASLYSLYLSLIFPCNSHSHHFLKMNIHTVCQTSSCRHDALFTTGFIGKKGINLRYFYYLCRYYLRPVMVKYSQRPRCRHLSVHIASWSWKKYQHWMKLWKGEMRTRRLELDRWWMPSYTLLFSGFSAIGRRKSVSSCVRVRHVL